MFHELVEYAWWIMKIEFFNDAFPWGLFILWTLVWWGVLARILTRIDLDTQQKLLWVIVVIFVPFFGMVLYCFAAPATIKTPRSREPLYNR